MRKVSGQPIVIWSDAAGTKDLGAFYINKSEPDARQLTSKIWTRNQPKPSSAFSITLHRSMMRVNEYINTKKMRADEQPFLHWGVEWKGKRVICHVDNQAVFHVLENRTIRGASMELLRRCLLLAAEYDIEIEVRWIPTKENALADMLSRFHLDKITNLAPQLTYPTCSY